MLRRTEFSTLERHAARISWTNRFDDERALARECVGGERNGNAVKRGGERFVPGLLETRSWGSR